MTTIAYRDATYSAETQEKLRELLGLLTHEEGWLDEDTGIPGSCVQALTDVVERWDANDATELLIEEAFTVAEQIEPLTIDEPGAVVFELRALRLTIAAAIAPAHTDADPVTRWCRVELFGHSVRYGHVTEVEVAGKRFLEITEPAIENPDDPDDPFLEQSKLYHPNAVYALEELDEEQVMYTLRRQRGLFRHDDGTWHTTLQAVDVDMDALEARDAEDTEDDDELVF